MLEDEVTAYLAALDGVVIVAPRPGDGSPEVSWGDSFFYCARDGRSPVGQPFATVVTKDYPGEPASGLDRPGAFRLNIDAGIDEFARLIGVEPVAAVGPYDIRAVDRWFPHPVYARAGWVSVVEPGDVTTGESLALLQSAYARAYARKQR